MLGPDGVPLELAALRQSRALIRLDLRSSAHTEGGGVRIQIRGALSLLRGLNAAMFLVAACARITWLGFNYELRKRFDDCKNT